MLTPKKTRSFLSEESVQKIRDYFASTSPRNLAIFELSLGSGLRRAEVLNLTWEDISWADATLQVLGKGGKIRIVAFTLRASEALLRLKPSTGKIFDILPNSWYRALRTASLATKVPERVHPHSIRHTYAMHCARNGIGVMFLQRALGHSFLSTTAVYLNASDRDAAKAIATIPPL